MCSMIKVSRALEHLAHPYGSGFIDNSSVRSRTKLIPGLCIPSQCVCVFTPHYAVCNMDVRGDGYSFSMTVAVEERGVMSC